MDGGIGHLRCRIHRARSGGPELPSLERLARGRLASALSDALDEVAGADGSVQVLRHVHVAFALTAVPDDAALCRQWAERLAAAIARALAQPEGENLVRFADQAEFVARFADALVSGSAWERWYFGAFAPLRRHGTGGALRHVLLEHRDRLPAILAWLERIGALERVLGALDEATARELLTQAQEADAIEPLLAAALRLLERAGRLDLARAHRSALLARYLQRGPATVSWRDRRALAEGVLDAVVFLVAEGLVRPARDGSAPLAEVLGEFDWLDAAWLGERLPGALAGVATAIAPASPRARRDSLTPVQRRVLAELAGVLADGPRTLDGATLDAPANVLRLTAAVAARGLAAVDSEALAGVITRVLRAAARLLAGPPGTHAARLLAGGDRAGAEAAFAAAGAAPLDALLLAELGRPAAVLARAAETPAAPSPTASAARPARVTPTRDGASAAAPVPASWAGALLLSRAALDLRLPALCEATGYPERGGFPTLLAALCVHWGAEADDPALALIAGEPVPDLTGDAHAFEQALARVLAAHGLASAAAGASPLERTASAVLRAWARWLHGFADASSPFLLRRLVLRDGALRREDDVLHVRIAPRPLDVVLALAGYFDPIDATRALGCRIAYEVVSVP